MANKTPFTTVAEKRKKCFISIPMRFSTKKHFSLRQNSFFFLSFLTRSHSHALQIGLRKSKKDDACFGNFGQSLRISYFSVCICVCECVHVWLAIARRALNARERESEGKNSGTICLCGWGGWVAAGWNGELL